MEKAFSLSIPETCGENWKNFTPADQGAFCKSCCKTVVDFTQMSDAEIVDFFQNRRDKTCGRFLPAQLKSYAANRPASIKPGYHALKAGVLGLILALTASPARAQQEQRKADTPWADVRGFNPVSAPTTGEGFTVRGIVTNEYGEAAPGVNVLLKGSTTGTITDVDGRFELSGVRAGDRLLFTFIGYESVEYVVQQEDQENRVDVKISMDMVAMMGAIAVTDIYQPQPESRMKKFWSKVKQLF